MPSNRLGTRWLGLSLVVDLDPTTHAGISPTDNYVWYAFQLKTWKLPEHHIPCCTSCTTPPWTEVPPEALQLMLHGLKGKKGHAPELRISCPKKEKDANPALHALRAGRGLRGSKKLKPGALSLKNALKKLTDGLLNSIDIDSLGKVCFMLCGMIGKKTYFTISGKGAKDLLGNTHRFVMVMFIAGNIIMKCLKTLSVEDLELIQEEDTNPSVDTSLNHEEDDQEIDEPQSDINLICRSTRTRRPTDRLCLYIDAEEHELGDLGEAAYILGIKIYRDRSKRVIGLNQSAYIEKILKRFYMENFKRGTIPMQEKLKLSKSQGALTPAEKQRMQNIPYASAIGSIMYAVRCIRPDVAFAQNMTSQFQQNPGEEHWTAVKNILKYLRNTKDMFPGILEGIWNDSSEFSCYMLLNI
ncbi:hypothetical protein Tco_0210160 [Tanacetum coccineum]